MAFKHTCHAHRCDKACPPKHLMCSEHWAEVPAHIQKDVYRYAKRRAPTVNKTWAPWWRAAHQAIAHVMRVEGYSIADAYETHEMKVADQMETME